jgi:tRNA-dihydrouridine synthase 3
VSALAGPTPTASPFAGRLWLAPLTVGGNLPFRRLCVGFGAEITVGEMAVVRNLLKGRGVESALLRSHPEEPLFGAQLADRDPATFAEGARIAAGRGARFIDLNCGCPIQEMTRRGLGASLLRNPKRIGRLVAAARAAVDVPVTVKLRLGWNDRSRNVSEVARICEDSGAAAIAIHGRSREQRFSLAADWELIGRVAAERSVPVVGNGDILTHYEARERRRLSGVESLMLARGALIKPWLFREIREGRSWLPTAEERLGVVFRLVELLREHFGVGEPGRARSARFLAWHLDFFSRYRPLPSAEYAERSRAHPLIQTRFGAGSAIPPLEALLRDGRPETRERLSAALVSAATLDEAREAAERLAAESSAPREAETPELEPREVAG